MYCWDGWNGFCFFCDGVPLKLKRKRRGYIVRQHGLFEPLWIFFTSRWTLPLKTRRKNLILSEYSTCDQITFNYMSLIIYHSRIQYFGIGPFFHLNILPPFSWFSANFSYPIHILHSSSYSCLSPDSLLSLLCLHSNSVSVLSKILPLFCLFSTILFACSLYTRVQCLFLILIHSLTWLCRVEEPRGSLSRAWRRSLRWTGLSRSVLFAPWGSILWPRPKCVRYFPPCRCSRWASRHIFVPLQVLHVSRSTLILLFLIIFLLIGFFTPAQLLNTSTSERSSTCTPHSMRNLIFYILSKRLLPYFAIILAERTEGPRTFVRYIVFGVFL